MPKDKLLLRTASTRALNSARGSSNPLLPVLAAFAFFIAFVGLSLWFTQRAKGPQVAPQGSSAGKFPTSQALQSVPAAVNPNLNLVPGFPARQSAQASSPSPAPPQSPFSSSFASPQSANLDASTAYQLVESWLSYKKAVFSAPYNISSIENYLVNPGPLYSDITRSGGSIDWLRSNNFSYYYRELKILGSSDFRQFPDRAHLTVRILEDLELRTPRGIDRSKSGRKTQSWIYELKFNKGKWLIYDYRKDV
ncbi:ARC6/PARC6 family protein [Cyanobium sp. HWJ4-Hawea]|uniref:ARC6/PARC6 family protein n=1 Tax=Cyanobium sp. HWJ4-Hawea TaxID=2823713 RepID=UPI0020CBCD57|nr:ARC6/PARC6 family protein [Cyanobium sp. HWJ4-Hawea]MCP9807886.1 ARC6/PARC6 family protein [Cyanobium sp. HWJ4-Hawea]